MSRKKQPYITIFLLIFMIILSFTCFIIGYLNYLEPKLGSFSINNIEEKDSGLYLVLNPARNAKNYEVSVTNQAEEEIFKTESTSPAISLNDLITNYGTKLTFHVTAKNKNGMIKESDNTYEYIWEEASFINAFSRYINTEHGLSLFLDGYQKNEVYQLQLEYLNQVIHSETIKTDSIYIPYQKLEGYAGRITAKLYTEQGRLISSSNFYINTPVVGKIKMTFPTENWKTRWNDINISFTGGENASEYHLKIFEEGTLVNTIMIPKEEHNYTLPASYLNPEKNYYLSIEAVYLDYEEITERDGKNIYIGEKETTNPVYVSHNPSFIKKGTLVKLDTRTEDATIYYTIDGSEPDMNSHIYSGPIKIMSDVTIKTYAVSKNRFDSVKNTYDFQVRDKELVVYLSPSNQSGNYGNKASGYTTEMQEMNSLTNVIERILKENGVKVYKNRSSNDINTHLSESNYVKSDLHLAIHSNASASHEARGIEIYIDKPTSKSLSIATNIYQNLYAIYPGKNIPNTNRGVKYANGSLGEANDSFIPCGTLIEIAYHDNYEDAKWILENKEAIGNNIATSILSYYN